MPVDRTPPAASSLMLMQSSSEPDITVFNDAPNVTSRNNKRPKLDFSPVNQYDDLKGDLSEVKTMLISWKNGQEALLNKLVNDLVEIKAQNKLIQATNLEIETTLGSLTKTISEVKIQIDTLEKGRNEFSNKIQILENKLHDLDINTRSSSIEIRNVPNITEESPAELTTYVTELGKTINLPIDCSSIRDIYRLPGKQNTTRPIIVEFSKVSLKMDTISNIRNFNKNKTKEEKLSTKHIGIQDKQMPIYVSEYLPGNTRKLFHEAKEFAKKYNWSFCWSKSGRIYLKKEQDSKTVHCIKSDQCFNELLMIQ